MPQNVYASMDYQSLTKIPPPSYRLPLSSFPSSYPFVPFLLFYTFQSKPIHVFRPGSPRIGLCPFYHVIKRTLTVHTKLLPPTLELLLLLLSFGSPLAWSILGTDTTSVGKSLSSLISAPTRVCTHCITTLSTSEEIMVGIMGGFSP